MSEAQAALLAVIVPVGPGDRSWQALLPDLATLPMSVEVWLVAPFGQVPTDFSASAFGVSCPVRWIESSPGRATQMNAGAAQTRASVLWFVHADSRLSPATLDALQAFVGAPHGLGYFDLHFLGDGPLAMRLNTLGAWIRSRWLRLPFGDQGFVMSAALFARLGGFDASVGRGEDHALVWQARRQRVPLIALAAPLFTSARKYAEHGWWRTTAYHLRHTLSQAWRFARMPISTACVSDTAPDTSFSSSESTPANCKHS